MVYTLPHAIKEEKNPEERVGNLELKGEKVGKLKVKKRNERGGSEGLLFLFFSFLSKGVTRENILTGEGGSFFFVKLGESTERVRLVLRVCFHLGRERSGCRGPSRSFFSLIYTCIFICSSDGFRE